MSILKGGSGQNTFSETFVSSFTPFDEVSTNMNFQIINNRLELDAPSGSYGNIRENFVAYNKNVSGDFTVSVDIHIETYNTSGVLGQVGIILETSNNSFIYLYAGDGWSASRQIILSAGVENGTNYSSSFNDPFNSNGIYNLKIERINGEIKYYVDDILEYTQPENFAFDITQIKLISTQLSGQNEFNGKYNNLLLNYEASTAIQNIYYGPRKNYLSFDGSNDYAFADVNLNYNNHTTYVKIKPKSTSGDQILTATAKTSPSNFSFGFIGYFESDNNSNKIMFEFFIRTGSSSGTNVLRGKTINDFDLNEIYNIVVSMGSSGSELYVNGIKQNLNYDFGNSSSTFSFGSINNGAGADAFAFGTYWYSNSPQSFINADIYDVAFYNSQLNGSTILDISNNGVNYNENSLIHYWNFSEGSGTTLGDSVGNNDGNIVGATWGSEPNEVSRVYLGSDLIFTQIAQTPISYTKYVGAFIATDGDIVESSSFPDTVIIVFPTTVGEQYTINNNNGNRFRVSETNDPTPNDNEPTDILFLGAENDAPYTFTYTASKDYGYAYVETNDFSGLDVEVLESSP